MRQNIMNQESSVPRKNNLLWLAGIVALVYACVFLYFAFFDNGIFSEYGYPIHNGGDSSEYALLTENLLKHGTFSLDLETPEMFRTPGYSFFLMPFVALDPSFMLAIAAQIALIAASAVLIVLLGRKFLPDPLPLVAALFFVFDPASVFYTIGIWSETPFVFLSLLSAWLLFAKEKRGWGCAALAGIALGCAALIRPAGEYLIVIYALVALFSYMKMFGWQKAAAHALLIVIAAGAVVAPWYARNAEESGALGLSTTGPYTFLFYHAKYFAVKSGVAGEDFDRSVYERLGVSGSDELRSVAYSRGMMEIVKETFLADFLRYTLFHGLGSANLFLGSSIRDFTLNAPLLSESLSTLGLIGKNDVNVKELFAQDPLGAVWYSVSSEPLLTLERILRVAMLALFALGIVFLILKKRVTGLTVLAVLVVLYTAAAIGPVSQPRYRVPLEPFFYLIAAAGLLMFPWKWRSSSVKLDEPHHG
jgi:4-amino-4-deoxy-L-arabinose transferase-like glycosyltransferase